MSLESKKKENDGHLVRMVDYTDLHFRLIINILEFYELCLVKHRNYELLDFYGRFKKDPTSSCFLVFTSLCIRYSSQNFDEIPFRKIRNLRCHHLNIPSEYSRNCTSLERLFKLNLEQDDTSNDFRFLNFLPHKEKLKVLEMNLVSPLGADLFTTLNQIPNLESLTLISFKGRKDYEEAERVPLHTLELRNLKTLNFIDFPSSQELEKIVFSNPFERITRIGITSCDCSNRVLDRLLDICKKNEDKNPIKMIEFKNCVLRESIINFFLHVVTTTRIKHLSFTSSIFELNDISNFEHLNLTSSSTNIQWSLETLDFSSFKNEIPMILLSECCKIRSLKVLSLKGCQGINDQKLEVLNLRNGVASDEAEEEEEYGWKNQVTIVLSKKNSEVSEEMLRRLNEKFVMIQK